MFLAYKSVPLPVKLQDEIVAIPVLGESMLCWCRPGEIGGQADPGKGVQCSAQNVLAAR